MLMNTTVKSVKHHLKQIQDDDVSSCWLKFCHVWIGDHGDMSMEVEYQADDYPICSMGLEYLPTFGLDLWFSSR